MPRTKLQTPNFNLQRRADGYYDIRYTENGKVKNKATGTKDPNEAEAFRARFVHDYRKPNVSKRPTVAEVCDAYVAYRSALVASPKTLPYSYGPINRHLGSLYADAITQTTVDSYIETREDEPVERKAGRWKDEPVSEATISKELRALRAALNWAASERLIERLPTFRIELSSGDTRLRWITKEDANKLMPAAAPHLALFILIALSTAKRREAILSLTWDRVGLHIQGHESINFGEDIGNKRRGSTPIAGHGRLIEALKAAKATAATHYVIEYRGERVKDVKTAMAAACRRAGIEAISAHVLKHTAITWMVHGGMTFEEIAKFTSTSKEVIERVYGHHSPAFVAGAAKALAF